MKLLFEKNLKIFLNRFYLVNNNVRNYTTNLFPYTNELYKKNYIKYPVQSKLAVSHDYQFHGDERLPNLEERFKEFNEPSDGLTKDIGKSSYYTNLKELKQSLSLNIRKAKTDKNLEKLSKDLKINVPIDKIEHQNKMLKSFRDILTLANHYNINKDLFGSTNYFRPTIDLNVEYSIENKNEKSADTKRHQVFYGNKIPTKFTLEKPNVSWKDLLNSINQETIYHSLLFVNLDGNLKDSNNDVLLWFLGNIKNGELNTGNEYADYVQPFPMRGTGWHRCVYVLFEHLAPIDFKINSRIDQSNNNNIWIQQRDFKASKFYSDHQNDLKPVGLSFFQCEWDLSVRELFHNKLNAKEPVYEFDFGPKFIPKFEKYPRDQVFNWYLQEYMDRKSIQEQVVKDYLKDLSPFEDYPQPAKYPILDVDVVRPKWFKYELENYRKRKHQWSLAPHKFSYQTKKLKDFIQNLPYQQQKQQKQK